MKKFVYKYLIFCSLLFCTFGTAIIKSAINNTKIKVESLIGESLSKEDQEFIDNIAKELDITNSIEAYYMNSEAQRIFGAPTVAVFDKVLFIWPYFLEALSISEKRFIIARELLVLNFNFEDSYNRFYRESDKKNLILEILRQHNFGQVLCDCVLFCDRFSNGNGGIVTGFGVMCLGAFSFYLDKLVKAQYCKNLVYQFDLDAAKLLNNFDGAISYLKDSDQYYSHVNLARYYNRSNTPTIKERIDRLERLKVENQEI